MWSWLKRSPSAPQRKIRMHAIRNSLRRSLRRPVGQLIAQLACTAALLAGSANLDLRSLFLNYELMVAFYEPADVKRFAAWVDDERARAVRFEAKEPGLLRDLSEGLLLWLAFQL